MDHRLLHGEWNASRSKESPVKRPLYWSRGDDDGWDWGQAVEMKKVLKIKNIFCSHLDMLTDWMWESKAVSGE